MRASREGGSNTAQQIKQNENIKLIFLFFLSSYPYIIYTVHLHPPHPAPSAAPHCISLPCPSPCLYLYHSAIIRCCSHVHGLWPSIRNPLAATKESDPPTLSSHQLPTRPLIKVGPWGAPPQHVLSRRHLPPLHTDPEKALCT